MGFLTYIQISIIVHNNSILDNVPANAMVVYFRSTNNIERILINKKFNNLVAISKCKNFSKMNPHSDNSWRRWVPPLNNLYLEWLQEVKARMSWL